MIRYAVASCSFSFPGNSRTFDITPSHSGLCNMKSRVVSLEWVLVVSCQLDCSTCSPYSFLIAYGITWCQPPLRLRRDGRWIFQQQNLAQCTRRNTMTSVCVHMTQIICKSPLFAAAIDHRSSFSFDSLGRIHGTWSKITRTLVTVTCQQYLVECRFKRW